MPEFVELTEDSHGFRGLVGEGSESLGISRVGDRCAMTCSLVTDFIALLQPKLRGDELALNGNADMAPGTSIEIDSKEQHAQGLERGTEVVTGKPATMTSKQEFLTSGASFIAPTHTCEDGLYRSNEDEVVQHKSLQDLGTEDRDEVVGHGQRGGLQPLVSKPKTLTVEYVAEVVRIAKTIVNKLATTRGLARKHEAEDREKIREFVQLGQESYTIALFPMDLAVSHITKGVG